MLDLRHRQPTGESTMSTARKTPKPSIKTLEQAFPDNAREARAVLKMGRAQLEKHPAGAARVRECYHTPQNWDVRLHVLNDVGNFHGLESIEDNKGERVYYLNAGDMYAKTIIYWRCRYRVQTLGDFIETQERQGKRFK